MYLVDFWRQTTVLATAYAEVSTFRRRSEYPKKSYIAGAAISLSRTSMTENKKCSTVYLTVCPSSMQRCAFCLCFSQHLNLPNDSDIMWRLMLQSSRYLYLATTTSLSTSSVGCTKSTSQTKPGKSIWASVVLFTLWFCAFFLSRRIQQIFKLHIPIQITQIPGVLFGIVEVAKTPLSMELLCWEISCNWLNFRRTRENLVDW